MKKFELTEEINQKWQEVVEAEGAPEIKDARTKRDLVKMLEVAEQVISEESNSAAVQNWDPILISMIRRTQPSLTTAGLVGIQPMTGPTGLIFVMRNHYVNPTTGARTETWNQLAPQTDYSRGGDSTKYSTAEAEALGKKVGTVSGTAPNEVVSFSTPLTAMWNEMDFTIEKSSVTAKSRALKARYTRELEQDLRAIHGMDAETELSTMLSTEIVAEIDREILGAMLTEAVNAGTHDFDADSDGRWFAEKAKGLAIKIERECNKIARGTRRGKGNFIVTSADVAGALNMIGKIDTQTVLGSFEPNPVGMAFVGVMAGTIRVYIDQYAYTNYVLVGYKGSNVYDAGLFYCPYVALEYMKATGEEDFQPRIGFKTRYALAANPFAQYDGTAIQLGNGNQYFRKFTITNM